MQKARSTLYIKGFRFVGNLIDDFEKFTIIIAKNIHLNIIQRTK